MSFFKKFSLIFQISQDKLIFFFLFEKKSELCVSEAVVMQLSNLVFEGNSVVDHSSFDKILIRFFEIVMY